ncbi:protein THEMIS2 [Solea solea]|uniref:protein THEMIS2 n=1 Tax=Solea solea TaxID=90069 RepID=UPI00272B5DBC|nr:protein THEMIS2 [Solea solea]
MAGKIALPLQQLISSLDNTCLPKILQVVSGVYFQGSVYELSGSEVSFSTGDLIKVTGIELHSVSCNDVSSNETFELPINHTGLFKVVPEKMPYSTLEEMLSLRPVGLDSCLPFTFTSRSKITIDNFTLGAGRALTLLCIEHHEGKEDQVRCQIQGQQEALAEVCIPLSARGEFCECESDECFTLQKILSSDDLRTRRFRLLNPTKCDRSFVISPIYQVHALMDLRKDALKFPSSLEVDVIDVTELCKDVSFVTPLSLTEVLSEPDESFPSVVEIQEPPVSHSLFKCSWLTALSKSKRLVFHKTGTSAMVLLSSLKSRKVQQYFLVSQQYGGRFRRRPREFHSVYELYVASIQTPGLRVSVTRNCEEVEEEGVPALSVGEQLEVVRCETMELPLGISQVGKQSVDALLCHRLQEPDDGDDGDDEDDEDEEDDDDYINENKAAQEDKKEELSLPLYMQGHFVEVLTDNKRYKLRDLGKHFCLPLDVKVVSRDTGLETDPLVGLAGLRIEGAMLEPTIQASFPNKPDHCFQIPTQWVSMSVSYTKEPLPWPSDESPKCHVDRVTEVTDSFFYEFRKRGNTDVAPPPRPPKRNLPSVDPHKKTSKSQKKSSKGIKSHQRADDSPSAPSKELANLTLNTKRRPPAPPPPDIPEDQPPLLAPRKHLAAEMTTGKAPLNNYVKMEETVKRVPLMECTADVDSDHDYETMDDSLVDLLKKAQETALYF